MYISGDTCLCHHDHPGDLSSTVPTVARRCEGLVSGYQHVSDFGKKGKGGYIGTCATIFGSERGERGRGRLASTTWRIVIWEPS